MPRIMSHQSAIFAALLSLPFAALPAHAGDIQVSLIGPQPSALVHAELIQLPSEHWPDQVLQRTSSRSELLFTNIPPGQYAIRLFVDENNNAHLDRSPRGIPQEPVGFSANPTLGRGEPSPSAAAFTHEHDNSVVLIRLRQTRSQGRD